MKKFKRDQFCPYCLKKPIYIISIQADEISKNYEDEIESNENILLKPSPKTIEEEMIEKNQNFKNTCCDDCKIL